MDLGRMPTVAGALAPRPAVNNGERLLGRPVKPGMLGQTAGGWVRI